MDDHDVHPSTERLNEERLATRQRAEARFVSQSVSPSAEQEAQLPGAIQHLLHELRVHQIELEMQNDQLRSAQTERDKAEAKYFDFYDMAPVGYVTVSANGLILHGNLTTATMLGVARSQLAKHALRRFIVREDQDTFYLLSKQLLISSTSQSCELRMLKHDSSQFLVRMDAVAACGDDGAPVLRLVLIDITASKEAELQRQAMDQAILNSVNAEVVVLDQQGIIRMANEPWQCFARDSNLFPGAPAHNIGIGTHYMAICLAGSNAAVDSARTAHDGIRAVLTGELPSFSLEYACHAPDQQRWFSMHALPLGKDPKDGATITHTEITAHRQAEEHLRIAAVAFETQEAIAVMDSRRQFLRVNRSFTQISGYSEQELLGRAINILYSTRHSLSFYENIWRETANVGQERGDRWIKSKNGDDIFAQGTTTAVKDQLGQTTHYVITFSDQTLKQQQNEVRRKKEAAHRDALVREVHHRIKNNLQGIGGLLQQFASQKPEIAEQMLLVSGHLNGISVIHGLQGRHDKSLVRLCELTREIAQATSVIWQTDITIDIPSAWVIRVVAEKEAVSLALVLNELLVNAVKHGGKVQGHVSVTLRQGLGIEGVDLSIVNAGYLRNNKNRSTSHHHGLQLVESLLSREGMTVTLEQHDNQVHTLLQMAAPVVSIDT
jgi:PAS domain S-box-containing protein